MANRVTIAQVAKEAGVSIATVSRVLNQREGHIKISDETKAVVQSVAARLNYQADPFASALRTRRSGLFGAIIRDLRDPFLIKVFLAMQAAARERGVELLLGNANYDISTAGRQASIMNSLWFDGLILLGDMPGDLNVIHQLQQNKKPCVAVACGTRHGLPSVNLNEEAGVRLALDYLTGLGHRRIACLGDPNLLGVKERLEAFQVYAAQHRLLLPDGYRCECPNTLTGAGQCAARLMELPQPPTAIFCCTDVLGLGVINQLNRSDIRVPGYVSVTGFDDIDEAASVFPALTTVSQLADHIAQQALELLVTMLDVSDSVVAADTLLVEPELVVRESCAPPRELNADLR